MQNDLGDKHSPFWLKTNLYPPQTFEPLLPNLDKFGKCLCREIKIVCLQRGGVPLLFSSTKIQRSLIMDFKKNHPWDVVLLPGPSDPSYHFPPTASTLCQVTPKINPTPQAPFSQCLSTQAESKQVPRVDFLFSFLIRSC